MVCMGTGLPFTCRDNPESKNNNNLKLCLLVNYFHKTLERFPPPVLISAFLPTTFEECIENTTDI